ncbi:MAG: META domain-containing protein [Caldilineales bacterium]|nr:META domain-containing protein [Caldilineales bacterium]
MKQVILICIVAVLVLTACGSAESMPLVGANWTLSSMYEATLLPDVTITAEFKSDGQLSGHGGCNNYGASYTVDGKNLTITSPNSTMMSCSEPIDQQESNYFYLLESVGSYEIKGDQLTLTATDGETVLTYTASE